MPEAYPLQWPAAWPRTKRPEPSRFKTGLATARDGLYRELDLLGARNVVISSNAVLLRSGEMAARQPRLLDPGVAAYFDLDGQARCIPADRWDRIEDNVRAIELTVAALRGLNRWGAKHMVDAAFAGFAALPAGGAPPHWSVVLGTDSGAGRMTVESAYRQAVRNNHPDIGGDPETFLAIQAAYERWREGGAS